MCSAIVTDFESGAAPTGVALATHPATLWLVVTVCAAPEGATQTIAAAMTLLGINPINDFLSTKYPLIIGTAMKLVAAASR